MEELVKLNKYQVIKGALKIDIHRADKMQTMLEKMKTQHRMAKDQKTLHTSSHLKNSIQQSDSTQGLKESISSQKGEFKIIPKPLSRMSKCRSKPLIAPQTIQ